MSVPRANFNPGGNFNNFAGQNLGNRGFNNFAGNNAGLAASSSNRFAYNNLRPWNPGYVPNGRWNNNRPFSGYHNNFVNGYWPGHYGGYGGYGGYGYGNPWGYGGAGFGLGLVSGLAVGGYGGWGLNPYSYGWGYSNFSNPFYGGGYGGGYGGAVGQPLLAGGGGVNPGLIPTAYDYSQPLDTAAVAPVDAVVNPAITSFDQARDAFKAGDYPGALAAVDQTIKALPNDADAHEFRGLTLAAMGRYKDAAATLYTVLAAGPGWDWTTLISLYTGLDPYEQQLRALEAFRNQNPGDPAPRFILAYLYTCQGATDAASKEYGELAKILPNDTLVKRLGKITSTPADANPPSEQPPANPTPDAVAATAPPSRDVLGTFRAAPNPDTQITLTRNPDGSYNWDVAVKGQSKPIKGRSTYQNDTLALTQENGPPLAGKVTWEGPDKFNFRLVGNGPEDPGLTFTR